MATHSNAIAQRRAEKQGRFWTGSATEVVLWITGAVASRTRLSRVAFRSAARLIPERQELHLLAARSSLGGARRAPVSQTLARRQRKAAERKAAKQKPRLVSAHNIVALSDRAVRTTDTIKLDGQRCLDAMGVLANQLQLIGLTADELRAASTDSFEKQERDG